MTKLAIEPRRILITGIPGAGKSTVGRLVAEGIERSVYINGDFIRESFVGGFAPPSLPFSDETIRQCELSRAVLTHWVEQVVAAGFSAVVDDAPIPFPPHFGDQYRSLLQRPGTVKVHLVPDPEEVRGRIAARGNWFDEVLLEIIGDIAAAHGQAHDFSDWVEIDNTEHRPEETAAMILDLLV